MEKDHDTQYQALKMGRRDRKDSDAESEDSIDDSEDEDYGEWLAIYPETSMGFPGTIGDNNQNLEGRETQDVVQDFEDQELEGRDEYDDREEPEEDPEDEEIPDSEFENVVDMAWVRLVGH